MLNKIKKHFPCFTLCLLFGSTVFGQSTTPQIEALRQRIALQRQQQYQHSLQAQNEAAERARFDKELEKISFGVEAETSLIRKNEIEGLVTLGEPLIENKNVGLDFVTKTKWMFADASLDPETNRVNWFPDGFRMDSVKASRIWAIIQDLPTDNLLSDQVLCLQVYLVGTVDDGERRYRKFTASKDKALEYLKNRAQ